MCSGANCTAVIKNKTSIDLSNLHLVWLQRTSFPVDVKMIKKGDFARASLPNIVYGTAPLKMYYKDNLNVNREYHILDKLTGFHERVICITITGIDKDSGLNYNVDTKYEPSF